jgi:hypothetical protein
MNSNTNEARRFVIVIDDDGALQTVATDGSILSAAQEIIGSGVTDVPCMDKRFIVLHGHSEDGRHNPEASVLAQEYVTGKAVVACGPAARLKGFSKYGAKDTVKYLRGLLRRDRHV